MIRHVAGKRKALLRTYADVESEEHSLDDFSFRRLLSIAIHKTNQVDWKAS